MLNADITLSKTEDWEPLGTFDAPFTGAFNGNGYEIIDLTIKDQNVTVIGMFAYAKDAHIGNVTLRNPDIESAFRAGSSIAPIVVFGLSNNNIYGNQIIEDNIDETPSQATRNLISLAADTLSKDIEPYKHLGVSVDKAKGMMMYEGRPVRAIIDDFAGTIIQISAGPYGFYGRDIYNAVDLTAVYENGALVGMRASTQEEYDMNTEERRRGSVLNDTQHRSFTEYFQDYQEWGMTFENIDFFPDGSFSFMAPANVFYNGELVRIVVDVDGAGEFHSSPDGSGNLIVIVIRDEKGYVIEVDVIEV